MLPLVGGQSGFDACFFQKLNSIPVLRHCHLRKQKTAKHAGVNKEAMGSDLNFFYRGNLSERRENRYFNLNIAQFIFCDRGEASG